MQLYKNTIVQILHTSLLLNLTILGASVLYAKQVSGQQFVPTIISIAIVFVQFWVLVLWNVGTAARPFLLKVWNQYRKRYIQFVDKNESREHHSSNSARSSDNFTRFCDSIFEDQQSLENTIQ